MKSKNEKGNIMARRGKIARLPKEVREELNQRLQNGEAAAPLIEWLNGLPAVQEMLKAEFDGRPINEPNLPDWRGGGYVDWEMKQEAELLRQTRLRADRLDEAVDGAEISDCLATVVAAELTGLARKMLVKETDLAKRWKLVCQVNKQLARLRRQDHREAQVLIQRERWERETTVKEKPLNHPELTPEQRAERIKQIYGNF